MREAVIEAIQQEKVIAIARGIEPLQCMKVADALYAGGIRLMEITFNQSVPESFSLTASSIAAICGKYTGKMMVGAGTVTTPELAELAASAGAQYIISPDSNAAVIRRTRNLGLVSIPGAMTPTEVLAAHAAGADFVKLFPAANLGIPYIKALCAPISHVKLMAVGGVNESNIAEFLKAGMCGAGVGGNLVNRKWIEAGEYEKLTAAARELIAAVKSV